MAAAAVPTLIAMILPLIAPVASSLIQHFEQVFQSKPKSGTEKLAGVTDGLSSFAATLAKAGLIPGVPSSTELATVAQTVFDSLNAKGAVKPAVDPGSSTLVMVSGWKVVGAL